MRNREGEQEQIWSVSVVDGFLKGRAFYSEKGQKGHGVKCYGLKNRCLLMSAGVPRLVRLGSEMWSDSAVIQWPNKCVTPTQRDFIRRDYVFAVSHESNT